MEQKAGRCGCPQGAAGASSGKIRGDELWEGVRLAQRIGHRGEAKEAGEGMTHRLFSQERRGHVPTPGSGPECKRGRV